MKGTVHIRAAKMALLIAALIIASPLAAQENAFSTADGNYYRVYSQAGKAQATDLARRLDAYAELFEEFLHFDRARLPEKLKVRIFSSQGAYTDYLAKSIGAPKDSFVFLQYSDPQKSELVGYDTGTDFESTLIHHAFIQYLKAFIPAPPLWIQKGMAIYLEKSRYMPEENRAVYHENLAWLKSLKTYVAMDSEIIPVSILLTMDVEAANRQIESFYAQSWGLVYFLLNSDNKEYNRIIWDALSALDPKASRPENESAVIDQGFAWVNKDHFLTDFESFVKNLKTFPELVEEGIASYNRGEYDAAEKQFNRSLELRKDHYIPYYYLGLIKYAEQDYTMSDYFYSQALDRGGAKGLIYYAKGITAYSAEENDTAQDYLQQVVQDDPSGYGPKAQELLTRIEDEAAGAAASPAPAGEPEAQDAGSSDEPPSAEPAPEAPAGDTGSSDAAPSS